MTSPAPEEILFTPLRLGPLRIANRLVMAPMTRGFSPNGIPGEDVCAYYERRAKGGVGLIVTEGVAVNAEGAHSFTAPRFYGEDALAAWARVVERVHAAGTLIIPQLWHVGATEWTTVLHDGEIRPPAARAGPSGLSGTGDSIARVMSEADIVDTIADFAIASRAAQRIGFDGVEIHGAHGYLPDQYLWALTNRRTDRYGGDAVARTRFMVELVAACRKAVGPHFPILLRYSQWKALDYEARLFTTPDEMEAVLGPIAEAGLDGFHCSQRRFWEPEFSGSTMNLAGWTKKLTGKAVVTVGSVFLDADFKQGIPENRGGTAAAAVTTDHLALLCGMIERAEVDLVAIERAFVVNPDLPAKVRAQRYADLRPFERPDLANLH